MHVQWPRIGATNTTQGRRNLTATPMISIVDDDSFVREAVGDLVESLGYKAATFPSAEDFLESGYVGETIV